MPTAQDKEQARLFAQLIAELEPEIRRGFMASVTDLQASVDWPALLEALQNNDMEGAIAALNIDAAAWAEYSSAMSSAYAQSGASTAAQVIQQGFAPIGTRFQMTNPRAQEWIARNVGESITGFVREQVQVARTVIEAGYSQGQGPRTIATDLVGRVVGGQRQGGVLGLDAPRADRFHNVSVGMRTAEGVQDLVVQHHDGTLSVRYKVNKATAQRIIKAYKAGTAVPAADRAISENQYKNALLKARADTVARTETASAVMNARFEQWEQLAELRGLDASAVIKTWSHNAGATEHHRPTHLAMNGKSVRGLYTPFEFYDGTQMLVSHDVNGGAANVINCRCGVSFRLSRGVA